MNGVSVWFNVNYAGATGYYASYYDDSSYRTEAELTAKYGVPKCGAAAPVNTPPANAAPNTPAPTPSISVAVGGQYGCGSCSALNVAVHNFPTGTYTYECHDNSGPGGADSKFYSHTVTVSDANQSSWPGVFCYDSGPYTAYLVMNGVRSNAVTFGGAGASNSAPTQPATQQPASSAPAGISASKGAAYGCGGCFSLDIVVQNFPTGTYTYECHDNSGPGGADTTFYSSRVAVTSANQSSWPGVFCYDSGPYTAYLVMNGVRSNPVTFGNAASSTAPNGEPGAAPASAASSASGGASSSQGSSPAGGGTPPAGTSTGAVQGGGTLYYSPYDTGYIDDGKGGHLNLYAPSPAAKTMGPKDWSPCRPEPANFNGTQGYRRITRLAAWSMPRNLPFKFLGSQSPWKGQIDYVLLFDPGETSDYRGSKCPPSKEAAQTLTTWLNGSPSRTLVVLAGQITAKSNYAGINEGLLDAVRAYRNRAIRKQVIVCPYPRLSHVDTWVKFRSSMLDPKITTSTCPSAVGVTRPNGWNP